MRITTVWKLLQKCLKHASNIVVHTHAFMYYNNELRIAVKFFRGRLGNVFREWYSEGCNYKNLPLKEIT